MRPWTADDAWHFHSGRHDRLHEVLGAFLHEGGLGATFRAWVPHVEAVSVVGAFDGWHAEGRPMRRVEEGIWEVFVPEARSGHAYKLRILSDDGLWILKADPFARWAEAPPATASRVGPPPHAWGDAAWLAARASWVAAEAPIAIYEVHLGSFAAGLPREEGPLYRVVAPHLIHRVKALGFTHVELMPVMEHPFGPSWGYQVTGFFAATARWGEPADLAWLVDQLHQAGIGVIFDWVPAHFPTDAHGLYRFNGRAVFEHPDERRGWHPEWTTGVFDLERGEVRSFLLSSATLWIEQFHGDGLRVDAVSSMLYLDYARPEGGWIPNARGGHENDAAVVWFQTLNELLHARTPGVLTIAEESTAWPGVTAPVAAGGLGFSLKWDLGWMHDTLRHLARPPVHRRWHHEELTFRGLYQHQERYVLPLSHDEVVHGKGSLLTRMPGDRWQQLANVRLLFVSMFTQPGKKLLFMGDELAPELEWSLDGGLPWTALAAEAAHAGVQQLVHDLLALLRSEPALHALDHAPEGFSWLAPDEAEAGVIAWTRWGPGRSRPIVVVLGTTPTPRLGYRLGVPGGGRWRVCLDSDHPAYGGVGLLGRAHHDASAVPAHGQGFSVCLDVPPLGALLLTPE